MPAVNPILTPDRGKAHSVAMAVLCGLAAVQVSAMARAVWLAKSKAGQATQLAQGQPGTDSGSLLGPPPVPTGSASSSGAGTFMTPPSVPERSTTAQPPVFSSTPAVPPSPVSPSSLGSVPPPSPDVLALIDVAQQSRPLGDLQGALEALKAADTKAPDHPLVLLEMAQTYDQMGLTDKALAAWEKIKVFGPNAGEAYSRALQRLGSGGAAMQSASSSVSPLSPSTGLTTPSTKPMDPSKILGLGPCEAMRDPAVTRGERLTLRIPIVSQPGQVVDPNQMDINVYFFDMVNGERVEQTKADVPVNSWVDAPVDWAEGQELLDVVYFMPETTDPAALRSNGVRKYHGYIVKLFYQNKLQDTVMEPASLQNFGNSGSLPGSGNPLLPPVTR